jgi:hypothetical protein
MSAQQQQALPLVDAFQRGCAPLSRARPPSGASPRHSPKASTPMAQPQNRVSSRRGAQGVLPARRMTPRVKHAPCRPVLLPADRCPGAARERIAFHPRAGTASRVHLPKVPSRKAPFGERDGDNVTTSVTLCQALVLFLATRCFSSMIHDSRRVRAQVCRRQCGLSFFNLEASLDDTCVRC